MKNKIITESTFETFDPKEYLHNYYSRIGSENSGLMEFFVKAYNDIENKNIMLEFGGGPTIYPLITAALKVKNIHFSDYLDQNLNEVRTWLSGSQDAFSWRKFFKKAMRFEGHKRITEKMIAEREQLLKNKMTEILKCNAFRKNPLGKKYNGYYDVINANFVTESITSSKKTWERLVGNLCSLLKDDGVLIMTAIKDAKYYHIGNRKFPATKITEADLIEVLSKLGFKETSFILYSIPAEVQDEELKGYTGYKGIIFLKASRS